MSALPREHAAPQIAYQLHQPCEGRRYGFGDLAVKVKGLGRHDHPGIVDRHALANLFDQAGQPVTVTAGSNEAQPRHR